MKTKPHIVLITADQLRKDSLSCYGNRAVKTPHLDRLAEQSIQFDRAYTTSPWCLPARCSLLSGKLPHNSGAYSNFRTQQLDAGVPNLFNALQNSGYHTSVFGKCHFTPAPYGQVNAGETQQNDAVRNYYLSLGIDHLKLQDGKQMSVWYYDDYSKELEAAGYLEAYQNAVWERENQKVFPFPCPEEWHPDRWVGSKAAEYINKYDDDQPLFTWISFGGPHFPFDPPESYLSRVDMNHDTKRTYREGEFDSSNRIHHKSYYGPHGVEGTGAVFDTCV
jgi:arylsulfatase